MKNAALRLVLQHMNDTGEQPEQELDTNKMSSGLTLSGYAESTIKRIALPAAADDQAVTFTNAIGLVLVSRDHPFSLRMADTETLLGNLRMFAVWADDVNDAVCSVSVLLTGNGSNVADIEAWIFEKPA